MNLIQVKCEECGKGDDDLFIIENEFEEIVRCKECSLNICKEYEQVDYTECY